MRFLVVDDDADTIELVSVTLRQRWPTADIARAETAAEALALMEQGGADLVILDIGLPDLDGREVLKRIRRYSDVPVVMLTGRDKDYQLAASLEGGADDYVTKPFSPIELLARIQAVVRRAHGRLRDMRPILRAGHLLMDFDGAAVFNRNEPVPLTQTEMRILEQLVLNAPRVVSYDSLASTVLGVDDAGDPERQLIRVYVQHLRSKLGDAAANPRFISNVHGRGYKFAATVSDASNEAPE